MSSTRHWNLERHIQRRHGGTDEPVRYGATQYYKDMTPQNFRSPLAYSHHTFFSSLTRKEKSYKKFSDVLDDILPSLRKMVEYKNLLSQLSTIQRQPQQQRMMPSGGGVYPSTPFMTFDSDEPKNNLSEHSRFEDDDDELEIVGYRGHACEKCSIISIDTVFCHNNGESGQIETTHRCNSNRLDDAQLKLNKDKIIANQHEKLPELMKKKVNSWTKDSAYLVAMEMPPNASVNNSFEISPIDDNHWARRAIKHKRTTLTDKELSDFLHRVQDSTYASFKVISPSSQQQQQQQESSTRYYMMMIIDNKINLSFELLSQYIKDISQKCTIQS